VCALGSSGGKRGGGDDDDDTVGEVFLSFVRVIIAVFVGKRTHIGHGDFGACDEMRVWRWDWDYFGG